MSELERELEDLHQKYLQVVDAIEMSSIGRFITLFLSKDSVFMTIVGGGIWVKVDFFIFYVMIHALGGKYGSIRS